MLRKIDNKAILSGRRVLMRSEVNTIAFRFNIANITPHGPDDGSVEPKRYSVDFTFH